LPVIEKYTEFEQLAALAVEARQAPRFAVRVKPATSGSGRWFESGGRRSKFGLTLPELVGLVEDLERLGWKDRLELLHFHLGSQISDIQVLKTATKELAQIYAELHARGIGVSVLDVGGGLGVQYGAGYGEDEGSAINYGLQEYANAIVFTVKEVCDQRAVPPPCIVSESGRALTAHHSVLVVPVLGAYRPVENGEPPPAASIERSPEVVRRLHRVLSELDETGEALESLLEAYHDAEEAHEEAKTLLRLGFLGIEDAAAAERLYGAACAAILERLRAAELEDTPPEQLAL